MRGKRKIVLMVLLAAAGAAAWMSGAAEEPTPQPAPQPVDAMYDRAATEGYAMRYPGENPIPEEEQRKIRENGRIERSPVLDAAFPLLEEGNPFTARYNLITGAEVRPLLAYGIPYFYGGRYMSKVLFNAPDYSTMQAWQSSKIYYRKNTKYFLGLDCGGLIDYVRKETGTKSYKISRYSFEDALDRKIMAGASEKISRRQFRRNVRIGDVIAIFHPGIHTMIFIGTLADYGYTKEDFPGDPAILSWPLVIHSGVNAVYADWFYHVKELVPKFRKTSVPDGGVTVSLLGYDNAGMIRSVIQQKQETAWVQMPDDTWLTVIRWDDVEQWGVYR